jgi:hypothetical protein
MAPEFWHPSCGCAQIVFSQLCRGCCSQRSAHLRCDESMSPFCSRFIEHTPWPSPVILYSSGHCALSDTQSSVDAAKDVLLLRLLVKTSFAQ